MRPILLLTVFFIVLTSCLKKDEFSNIPAIDYKEMRRIDNDIVIKFSFTDGDGDIGLTDEETSYPFGPCDPYYKNLIIEPYILENGNFILARKVILSDCSTDSLILWDTVGYDQRIKHMTPDGRDKSLEGDIEVTLNEACLEYPNDTVKFKLRLIDRALNTSNEIESEAVLTL